MTDVQNVIVAAHFSKDVKISKLDLHFKADTVSLLSGGIAKEILDKKFGQIWTMNALFNTYKIGDNRQILFTHIGGGIGDIIASSAIIQYLKDSQGIEGIYFFTAPQYFPILDIFRTHVIPRHLFAPIVENFSKVKTKLHVKKAYGRLAMEFAAVEGREKNWYLSMFERIGEMSPPRGYLRPQLFAPDAYTKSARIKAVMICHKASCQIRSSRFEDFYIPVHKVMPKHLIIVNKIDLTNEDSRFIEKHVPGDDILILDKSLPEYFNLLDRVDMVVSTDSAPIHYREGIGKPCLGVFGAMTTESRTKYYLYTRSFNVATGCKYQPCFKHELKPDDKCPAYKGEEIAPCQSGKRFKEQLESELMNYVKEVL